MNKIVLVGRLAKDPERGKGEHPRARFRMAVDRPYKREGEPNSDFFDVIAFDKTADTVMKHLTKGRLVAVAGRAQWRTWETAEKERKKVFEVIAGEISFLDAKPKDTAPQNAAQAKPAPQPASAQAAHTQSAPAPSNPAESMDIPDFGAGFDPPDFDLTNPL